MDWQPKKEEFNKRHEKLSQYFQNEYHSDNEIFSDAMKTFIKKGGVYQDLTNASNNDAQQTIKTFKKIAGKLHGFETLNTNIMRSIRELSERYDSGRLFKENIDLHNKITQLEKKRHISINNLNLSKERNNNFKNNRSDVTAHKLFLLKAPVPKSYIPYMWSISIVFLAFGIMTLTKTISLQHNK